MKDLTTLQRRPLGLATLVAALLALPAPAGAAVSATRVLTPSGGAVLAGNFTVSGTAVAASGDKVDLLCTAGAGPTAPYVLAAQNVPVDGNGSFSVSLSPADLYDRSVSDPPPAACSLRAVPSGTVPDDVAPFVAAKVAPVRVTTTTSGFFDVRAANFSGGAVLDPVGGCAVCGTYVSDPSTLRESAAVFSRALALGTSDGSAAAAAHTRSEIRVDSQNAYAPTPLTPGSLSFSRSVDPATGAVTVHESESIFRCSGRPYLLTEGCGTSSPAGVRLLRTIVTGERGRSVRVTDSWESTDGHSHRVELWYDQLIVNDTIGENAGYRFPGETTVRPRGNGDSLGAPAARPDTIYVKSRLSAPDGDGTYPPGALTYDTPYDRAQFIDDGPLQSDFVLQYTRTVAPGRPFRLRHQLAAAFAVSDVAALAHSAEDLFGAPRLSIASPRTHATLTSSLERVRGIARDNYAVTSLKVAGRAVRIGPGGYWSTRVRLHRGSNTIVGIARDKAGTATSSLVRVTYRPCVVPRLTARTLAAAKRSLRWAGCLLGRVGGPRSASRVTSQTARAGRVLTGSHRRVGIVLGF